MLTEELQELFGRWLNKEITAEEQDRLMAELNGLPDNELEELLNRSYENFVPGQDVFSREQSRMLLSRIKQSVKVIPWWRTPAAAAVVAAVIVIAGYFVFFNRSGRPIAGITQEQHFKNDLAPGGSKATLTLANGSVIILDSARLGAIAKQGGSHVSKTDSGTLAYHTETEKPSAIVYNTLTTPRGGQYQLQLPDGSKVWLNAASSIKYPTVFNGKERLVEITGEAYFEVVHNARMPFKVKAGNQLIEDLGTRFNVNAYADEPVQKITLLEGSVKVSTKYEVQSMKSEDEVILKPGEQAIVSLTKPSYSPLTIDHSPDLKEVIAWKEGNFRFNSAGLESILRQAARWYDVEIEYRGKINETFSGGISRNVNASQLLHILELTQKVSFDIEGKKIIVKPADAHE